MWRIQGSRMRPVSKQRFLRQMSLHQNNTALDPPGLKKRPTKSAAQSHSLFPPKKIEDRFIPVRAGADWDVGFNWKKENRNGISTDGSFQYSKVSGVAYRALLRNEVLGAELERVEHHLTEHSLPQPSIPGERGLFSFGCQSKRSSAAARTRISPYSLSMISNKSQNLLYAAKANRNIYPRPFKTLDAPGLKDDFCLHLLDWSSQNVLATGLDTCVYLCSPPSNEVTELCDLSLREDSVTSVSWAERGDLAAVGTEAGYVQIWDANTGRKLMGWKGHTERVGTLVWNGDQLSLGGRDGTIQQRDIRTRLPQSRRRLRGHRGEVCGLKWSCDRELLASGGDDNKLLVWNQHSLRPAQTYLEHKGAVRGVAWCPYQRHLLASGGGTDDCSIRLWNTLTQEPVQQLSTGSAVCNLAWSKRTNELVSTHGEPENNIVVWKCPSLDQVANLHHHTHRVLHLTMSPGDEMMVTGSAADEEEKFCFWNFFTNKSSKKDIRFKTPHQDILMFEGDHGVITR